MSILTPHLTTASMHAVQTTDVMLPRTTANQSVCG